MTPIWKKTWSTFAFIILAVFVSGCHEVKRHYVINPDLSGKVEIYSKTSIDPFFQLSSRSKQPDSEKIKQAVKSILDNTIGIDTWKDIQWNVNDEGKLEFKGTAYFKDFNTLNLDTSITSSNKLILTNDKNKHILQWKQVGNNVHDDSAKAIPLTGEALEKQIKIEKAKFKASFGMLSSILNGFKEEEIFSLPGEKQSVKGFKMDGNKVVLSIIGEDVLSAINKLAQDDNFWHKATASGEMQLTKDAPADLQLQVFGALLPFEAIYSGGKNQFDYQSELAAGKSNYPALLETLGIVEKSKPITVATSGYSKFKSIRVGGLTQIFESDPERGIRPNSQDKGYILYLIAEWKGAVHKVDEVIISEAVTDDGQNLLPDESLSSFVQLPQLSDDKAAVVFPAVLKIPGSQSKTLKKLSGKVSFTIVSEAKSHDSGLIKLAVGSKTNELGMEITKANKSEDTANYYSIAFKLNINSNLLTSIKFYDDKKNTIESIGSGTSCVNNDCEIEYNFEGEMPKKIGIIVDAYDQIQKLSTPFTIENLPINGK